MGHIGCTKVTCQPNEPTRICIRSAELHDRYSSVCDLARQSIAGPKYDKGRVPVPEMGASQQPGELALRSISRHPADDVDDP
jgi:hypothetical protein